MRMHCRRRFSAAAVLTLGVVFVVVMVASFPLSEEEVTAVDPHFFLLILRRFNMLTLGLIFVVVPLSEEEVTAAGPHFFLLILRRFNIFF